ncbi:acyloxyacyl hydrolase [Amaricoccus sp.]|uniref:acyloxyacyl hydrolase n=1 Tax=Amaricoccus sp. TaxID=1872485 RepID=UPI00262A1BC3|nr:acyloxyacyl hydrolase [Amaricoccus sp.]HRO11354.1 acyloxyacyl hydrolase [Amaricoccus sp.]
MRLAAVLVLALAAGTPARAADFTLGLGYDDLSGEGSGAATVGLQVTSEPIWQLGAIGFGLGVAGEADTAGDLWAGAGLTAGLPLGDAWRVGGSVMAGFYAFGDGGDDLGSDLEFRTRLGVSREIRPPWRLGLAIEHKSNGGIGEINPGIETIFVTLTRPF